MVSLDLGCSFFVLCVIFFLFIIICFFNRFHLMLIKFLMLNDLK